MPTTYEELRERLSREPLPTTLPIRQVTRVMEEMGYTLRITASHYHFRKPGARRVTFSVHGKRISKAGVSDLAALFREWGA